MWQTMVLVDEDHTWAVMFLFFRPLWDHFVHACTFDVLVFMGETNPCLNKSFLFSFRFVCRVFCKPFSFESGLASVSWSFLHSSFFI